MTKLKIATPPATQVAPQNIAAQITVTAFTDGRPVDVRATCDPLNALLLLNMAMTHAVQAIQRQPPTSGSQANPVDKERKFLGPRKD